VDFIFQGFDSSLPPWLFLLIFAGTTALAWWSYHKITGIRKTFRYLLIAFRSAVFFILLVLLLNPFFKKETYFYQKPNILVMLDNSASTAIEKADYQGSKSYHNVLQELNFGDSSRVHFQFFAIGNKTQKSSPKKLTLKADQTDLSETIRAINENQSDANAALLLSDGIFTKGQNPVFDTQNIEIPIFSVGLGDTTFQKDVLVSSVSTNSTGYLHTRQAVSAAISSKGFKGRSFQVQLKKGDRIIESKTISADIDNSTRDVTFELPLENEGLQQFKIEIPKLADEWTDANNTELFSVDVKDAKQKVLSLAFEIHPDVKFIRKLLSSDQNINLTSRTWLGGNRFVEGPLAIDPDTLNLAIIQGYPQVGLSGDLKKMVSEIAQKVPLIVVATPLFSPQRFEQEVAPLPVSITGRWNYAKVALHPDVPADGHPIMELPAVTYEQLPMISAPIEHLDNIAGPTKLLSSTFQGNDIQKPILTVQELGNRRESLFTAFGWYRMAQSENPQIRKYVDQLWLNTVSWTATNPKNKLLDVQPSQRSFTGSEPVVINAYLNNERGEVENDANIDISVASDSLEKRFYSMDNKGDGKYQLNLGSMPEGIYSFEATAKKGSRQIDTRQGEFAVARSNAEYIATTRNTKLLRQLSENTGGTYTPFDSVSGFWDTLDKRGLLDQTKEQETTFMYPYQHASWFIAVVVLLCAEWIFRKYLALP